MEKNLKNIYMYIHVCVTESLQTWQHNFEPIQHCKLTILQLKKNKKNKVYRLSHGYSILFAYMIY